jgi:hypothetical protein
MRRATTLPGRPQLETMAEAQAQNLGRVDALVDRAPEIAAAIEGCTEKAPCESMMCAVGALEYRAPVIDQTLAIARSRPGQHLVATIFLGSFLAGKLHEADVKRAHGRLRKSLERYGFKGAILIGGTELNWDSSARVWELHVHVTAIDVPPRAWRNLRRALRDSGPEFPVKVQLLRNPEWQISYSIKFVTYFRPRARSGAARPPAVPLPPDRLAELAVWWSGYRFDDFLFLFGAKRRGGRIALETARNSPNT